MANSNGVISDPIRIGADIRTVTKQTTTDFGVMSRNAAAVNPWSLCKPMKVSLVGAEPIFLYTDAARREAYKKVCYGLTNIPCLTRAINMSDWMMGSKSPTYPTNMGGQGKENAWTWRTPTLVRGIDWNDYYHNAQPPVTGITPEKLHVPFAGTVYVDVNLNGNSREIKIQDLCQRGVWLPYGSQQHTDASAPYNLHLGLCIVNKSETSRKAAMIIRSTLASDESGIVTFSFFASQFSSIFKAPSGAYTVFAFLASVNSSDPVAYDTLTAVNSQQGAFYPINCSETDMTITSGAADLTVSVWANRTTATSKSVDAYYEISNRSEYGVYVQVRLELLSGAVSVDTWDTARLWLPAKGNLGTGVSNPVSMYAQSLTDLDIRAIVDVFETNTSGQAVETIETRRVPVTVLSEIIPPDPGDPVQSD